MRRLQSMRQRLPGRKLHYDGTRDRRHRSAHRPTHRQRKSGLDDPPEQSAPQTGLVTWAKAAKSAHWPLVMPAKAVSVYSTAHLENGLRRAGLPGQLIREEQIQSKMTLIDSDRG